MLTQEKSLTKDKPEYHIIIIWSNAQKYVQELLNEIEKETVIIKVLEISWPNDKFENFLMRFYGDSLRRVGKKVKECGRGPFKLIVVKDCKPTYQVRNTSSSLKIVNSNIFDLKMSCRKITNAGHLIHASDDFKEASFQYKLLTGEVLSEIEGTGKGNERDLQLVEKLMIGANGWSRLDDIWYALSGDVDYIVLRNFETLEDELNNEHPDIDILTSEKNKFIRILGLQKAQNDEYRAQYYCFIAGRKVNFDLRVPKDGYYPAGWAFDLINNKSKHGLIKVVNRKDYFWSLMYHALFHKRAISADYFKRLHKLALEVEPELASEMWDREILLNALMKYLLPQGFIPTEPEDHTVYYNYYSNSDVNVRSISKRRMFRQYRYKLMSKIKLKIGRIYAQYIKN